MQAIKLSKNPGNIKKLLNMKIDKYGEIINSPETYKNIAEILRLRGSCMIGWTDEQATHFDILFTFQFGSVPTFGGQIQGGVRGSDLFISIMRVGSFGFDIKNTDTHWGYYNEKLGSRIDFGEVTGSKLAELFNGVKKEL